MSSSAIEEHHQRRDSSLKYFIEFPAPNSAIEQSHSTECDFNFTSDETNKPIILLLGWIGCQDRYLMKYSKIYEDRGLITVRYTPPLDKVIMSRHILLPIARKIVKLMYDRNFDKKPIIIHLFSNGGAYLYKYLDIAMTEFQPPLNVCGIIFDSSPGDFRMLTFYRMIFSIYGKKYRFASVMSVFIVMALKIKWLVDDLFLRSKSIFTLTPDTDLNSYNHLKYLNNNIPQLFLYSKADRLVIYEDVESFARFRKLNGAPVKTICFHDAEHVKLYPSYPQRYIQCVCTFISNCLTQFWTNDVY